MTSSSLFRALSAPFRPPFEGLAVLCFLYFVYCSMGGVLQGLFPDSDDYIYLLQTLDWLGGQEWFDNVQHRLAPPDGVPIHYTRLAELPLAGLITFFVWLGMPLHNAATATAALYPAILLACFFWAARWVAKSFLPSDWVGVTAYTALFSLVILTQFTPGRVDHHGVEGILVLLSYGAAVRLFQEPAEAKWGALSGFLMAAALAIALESLPWVFVVSGFMGLWLVVRGRVAAAGVTAFALSLYLGSVLFLVLYKRPADWFQIDVLAYSVVYVGLTGGIALACVGTALAALRPSAWLRYAVGLVLAVGMAVGFFWHFPEMLIGPYGAMDKELAHVLLDNITEAQPLLKPHAPWTSGLSFLLGYAIAIAACLYRLWKDWRGNGKWTWGLSAALLIAATALGAFYQIRLLRSAGVFSVIPMAVLLFTAWRRLPELYTGRKRFWAELGLLCLVGPLPAVFVPAMIDGRSFNTGVLLFPAAKVGGACDTRQLVTALGKPRYQQKSFTIMNMLDQGAELMFRTRHRVMAAPYHTNVRGNLDAIRFFKTPDVEEAHRIVEKDKIDLIVMCRLVSKIYLRDKDVGKLTLQDDGKLKVPPEASFTEKLMYGKQPDWLRPVHLPKLENYLIYEVRTSFPDEPPAEEVAPPPPSAEVAKGAVD